MVWFEEVQLDETLRQGKKEKESERGAIGNLVAVQVCVRCIVSVQVDEIGCSYFVLGCILIHFHDTERVAQREHDLRRRIEHTSSK